jgi:hypothetical protein
VPSEQQKRRLAIGRTSIDPHHLQNLVHTQMHSITQRQRHRYLHHSMTAYLTRTRQTMATSLHRNHIPLSMRKPSPNFRVLAEISHYRRHSHSTVSVHSTIRYSRLTHKPAPFNSDSRSSVNYYMDHSVDDDTMGRRSNDSEQRPFEHSFRDEISRNGGVGELRVAKRQEIDR